MSQVEQVTGEIVERSTRIGSGDPSWLAILRADAAAAAETMSFPDSSRERPWKYLDISGLDLSAYRPFSGALAIVPPNGPGTTISTLATADEGATTLASLLGTRVAARKNRLTALHYAYLQPSDVVLIETAPNVEAGTIRISRSFGAAGSLVAPHTLIVTHDNSRVSVVEDFRSAEGDILALPVVEVVPGPGSEVRYTALHRWGSETRVFTEQTTVTERDSAFIGLNVVVGGLVVKGHLHSSLEGRGSSSELYGACFGEGRQHSDFYTIQDHVGPDTRSDLLYKAALTGRSRSVYYGLTRVGLEAKNADANQENRNLLLSKHAKADSDPVLEILTSNIIRCSHGATAGPVDEEQLFYLQARGIPRPIGEAMLVRAFLGQVLDRVPDEKLREEIEAIIDERLGDLAQ